MRRVPSPLFTGEARLNLGGLHCSYPDGSGNRQAITLAVHVKLCATQVEGVLELILEQVSEIFFHFSKVEVSRIPSSIGCGERSFI